MNNGFYEGIQNHIAIQQMKLCVVIMVLYGGRLQAGKSAPFKRYRGHGPTKKFREYFRSFAININRQGTGENFILIPFGQVYMETSRLIECTSSKARRNGLKRRIF